MPFSTAARPTMADVAELAGVSVKTVSRVVNDEAGVSAATARRVRQVIDDLGFQRHDGASLLRTGRSQSVGLIVDDLANPFYSRLASAIERQVRMHHNLLISASSEQSMANEAELIDALVSRRVDGLILVPSAHEPSEALRAAAAALPVVCVDRPAPGVAVDAVLSDNQGGIRSAVEHLVAHRHSRIAFLGDDGSIWTARQRQIAFDEVVSTLNLPGPLRSRVGPYAPGEIADLLASWTSGRAPTTALITGNNRVTIAVLEAVKRGDRQFSLVGYDDFDLADVVEPPVTVVHQDPAALGQRAVQQLFARLAGDTSPPQTVVVSTRLIVRESGRAQT